jgi:hypothetical protein
LRGSGSDGGRPRLGLDPSRPEPARVGRSGAPYLVPALAALLAALALGLGRERIASCGRTAWQSPEAQVRAALANQHRAHLSDVYGFRAGGVAELSPLRFVEPVVSVEGRRAQVAAMVDAEGRVLWREQVSALRYLGRERFGMHACDLALWCGEGDQFARLRGVLLALFRRHDARAAADPAALAPLVSGAYADRGEDRQALLARLAREWRAGEQEGARIRAWQIRVERETAEVGEDAETPGPAGPQARRALYRLAWDGSRWAFVAGL